jgi:Rps23 Pro-64 3,4-dihydroxylase Tpa1-like proline 4-hydroxylase
MDIIYEENTINNIYYVSDNIMVINDILDEKDINIINSKIELLRIHNEEYKTNTNDNLYNNSEILLNPNKIINITDSVFKTPPSAYFDRYDLKLDDFFTVVLFEIMCNKFNISTKNIHLYRCELNYQSYACDGSYHIDYVENDAYTIMLYLQHNKNVEKQYYLNKKGYFHIIEPDSNVIKCIPPIFNSCILFKGNYFHKGSSYSKNYTDYRIGISWKFTMK